MATRKPKTKSKSSNVIKTDGWANVLASIGGFGKDRTRGTSYASNDLMTQNELTQFYLSNGIAKRIVDLIPDEMTRQWITVEADTDNLVLAKLDELNAKTHLTNMLRWSRLYGGCIIVLGIDDGGELTDPVNEDQIKDVKFMHVFDRYNIWWTTTDLYNDIQNPKYGTPEIYHVTPYHGGIQFPVHESRVLRLQGEILPTRTMIMNQGWGSSIIQSCYEELRNLGSAYAATSNIMLDFIQTILKVANLADMMAAGQDELIKKRLELIDLSRSVANTIMIDAQEEYTKMASSVSGLSDLIDDFGLALASVTGIPYTLLMGKGVAGLNATGDSDIRLFYDKIKSEQQDRLRPLLERLIRLIMLSKNGPFKGVELENWNIVFNPLWQMTDTETAAYRYQVAQTDQIYIQNGVVDPAEVAASRWGGDTYSGEMVIEFKGRDVPDMSAEETKDLQISSKQSSTGILTTGAGTSNPLESEKKNPVTSAGD